MEKRTFDLIFAVGGLMLLFPIFVGIAVLVKSSSKGPILYRGVRTGRYGIPFRIIKFRTMVKYAEKIGGGSTAQDDPRITWLGKFLRRYKLDELPQLINVIIGDMSIVGPRPELPSHTRLYSNEEMSILSVRPGITDYASIEYIRLGSILGNDAPDNVYIERVRPRKNVLRIKYISEQSFNNDLRIILRTLIRVARS